MTIEAGERTSRRRILLGVIGLIAFVALAFLAVQAFQYLRRPVTAAQLEAEMERQPETREAYRALRHYYPHDADAFYARAAAAANAGGVDAAKRAAFLFIQQFMRSKAVAIARGSTGTLQGIAREYSALLHVLRSRDVAMCAQLSMSGIGPGQTPPAEALAHFNRILALQLQAAHEGEAKDARSQAALSNADRQSFVLEIGAIDHSLVPLLDDQRALNAAPAVRQCDLGTAVYDAAAALPTESSARITAELIRSSLAQGEAPAANEGSPGQSPGRPDRPNQKDSIR